MRRVDKEAISKLSPKHRKGKEYAQKGRNAFLSVFLYLLIRTFDLFASFPYNKGEIKYVVLEQIVMEAVSDISDFLPKGTYCRFRLFVSFSDDRRLSVDKGPDL